MSCFDQAKDDCDHGDGEALLDLSILNTPTLHMITESAPNGDLAQRNQEDRVEEHRNGPGEIASESVIINLDMINRHLNAQADEEENIERSRQSSHFLRMVCRAIVQCHKNNLFT